MTASEWFMDVGGQILQGLNVPIGKAFNAVVEETEGMQDFDAGVVQVAYAVRPGSISPQDYITRSPYTKPETFETNLAGSAERGWLEATGDGQYAISAKGVEVVKRFVEGLNDSLRGVPVLQDSDMKRLYALMERVVDKARALPEPAEKSYLDWGKHFQKAFVVEGAPKLVWVRRRILDMFAFRDDVHIAAWKAYEKSGQVWEAFTFIWRGDATTAAELVEKLPFRSYDEESYTIALKDLADRGWIVAEDGMYVATEKGEQLRQEAEDATNRYFDVPWAALDEAETEEIKSLLGKLAEAVKPPEEDAS